MERDFLKTRRRRQVFPKCIFWVVFKKYNLLLIRLNCGHVTSRSRSGGDHVVWLNCKITFIGLVVQ